MTRAPLPGGPLHHEFRDTIEGLAKQAQEEDRRAEQEARRRNRRRSFSRFVAIGSLLIFLELVSLLVLSHNRADIAVKKAPTPPRGPADACKALVFSTYWKVVSYIKDNEHAPPSLNDLVPKYIDKIPLDPLTGKALDYSTDGKQIHLDCPKVTLTGR